MDRENLGFLGDQEVGFGVLVKMILSNANWDLFRYFSWNLGAVWDESICSCLNQYENLSQF